MNAYDGAPQAIWAAALARDWKLRRIHSLKPLVRALQLLELLQSLKSRSVKFEVWLPEVFRYRLWFILQRRGSLQL